MITNYKIKDESLILYLNYNYELAKDIKNIDKKFNLIKSIKEYINKAKINFKGKYIVLVIAGVTSITLVCNSSILDKETLEFIPSQDIIEILRTNPYKGINKNEIVDNKENIVKNNVEVEINQTKKEETNSIQKIDKIEIIDTVDKKEDKKVLDESKNTEQNINTGIKEIENSNKIETNNEIYVTIYRSNGTIETIELETYLIGVVASEMPASFNIEALKAQAIISRTYALKKISSNQVLTDTTSTQVYKDAKQLKNMWGNEYDKYYSKVKKAVLETKGLVIKYNNNLIDAVYHSTSNGYTVDAIDVWGNDIPYLKSVSSEYDLNISSYLKETFKELNEINNKLGISISEDSEIEIIRNDNNRVIKINIDNNTFDGIKFRNLLGLRSTDFDISFENNQIKFTTRGYGHGVGMSQYGANGMANNGYNYKQIINHYYTNVYLDKI